jgi:hypothetical protein
MDKFHQLREAFPWLLPVIAGIMLWEAFWKIFALWKAANNKQLAWFICIAVINSAGILPIIYLILNRKKTL